MGDKEKIDLLKIMLGDSSIANEVLSAYLLLAGKKIIAKAFPYRTDVKVLPEQYDYLQLDIAAYMINKRGADYQSAHNENGIARTWESSDIPPGLLNQITPMVGVI